jgi:tRNA 5-methylaminomethyl-2-thiouridine biosynthesis bifunctional protein
VIDDRNRDLSPVDWTGGMARSLRYGDIYHSSSGGLAQARHVFLDGCGLPRLWAGARDWNTLETGFGLGLNFLALRDAWQRGPHAPARLCFVSVEAHPVRAEDIRRAGASNGAAIDALASELAQRWPSSARNDVRLEFDDGRVCLQVLIGDAANRLRELPSAGFTADSIFLDGFNPAGNPSMWSQEVLAAVAGCARPHGRLATWTVSREVRNRLEGLGFSLRRRPGLPPKRHCLQGVFQLT